MSNILNLVTVPTESFLKKKNIDAVLKHISDQNKQHRQPLPPPLAIMDV